MSHTNRRLIDRIPPDYRDYLGYYPDTLFYQHDSIQYRQKLARLAQASYLYSDGYTVKSASYFRYLFESFKGWFGFTNHCQPEKAQLALRKFTFYGYLRGYTQPQGRLQKLGIDAEFLELVSRPRTSENSQELQNKLIEFCIENESGLETISSNVLPRIAQNYRFGTVLFRMGFWSEIPSLDPQNEQLIQLTVQRLESEIELPSPYSFIPGSKYALAAANCYLERAKAAKGSYFYGWSYVSNSQANAQSALEQALTFDPEISSREKTIYIEYYLEKKELAKAIALIHQLDDPEQALKYIRDGKYSETQLQQWVKKDSWLASVLSTSYLMQRNDRETLEFVDNLHSNLPEQRPVQAFSLLVSQQKYDDAYSLFAKSKGTPFLDEDIAEVANFYSEESERLYKQGHGYRQSKNWKMAKEYYLKSASMKRRAKELEPNDETRENEYFAHKRLYAQLLIDADIELNSIDQCQIEEILKAVKFLRECNSTDDREQKYNQKALAKGLMRQVDYLVFRVLTPTTYDADYQTRVKHLAANKTNFENMNTALHQIITLLDGTKDKQLKLILGKAYFLLADVADYFSLEGSSPSFYIKAQETVPDNPFYLLRRSERFPEDKEKYQRPGIVRLKQLGFAVIDWLDWDKERWQRDYRSAQIKDIHYYQSDSQVLGLQLRS
ncbi:hypothetical protein BN59_03142 [Legionella massiliensis]|uniref:Uncharacterized protein n=1 Tax=Legionella massiliensis TaxID=1034943 RepID=A0A078L4H6_9GAMM|nr:hypothetical protein [Legionella massiliensis]CDZ78828.1 hypothetical protein BN59_03142 [Legionella massiliensis]CEE14566.1 hypothetical protein BN1094_03142 [Legionella massiliensis]